MKSLITLSTALAIWICSTGFIQAQKNTDWTKNEIEKLKILKENAVKIEKEALKSKIENINKKVSEGSVSETEAENLKKAAAEKHALNIDNRIAIFDNQLALIDRNGMDSTKITGTAIVFGWGQEDVDNDLIFGVKVRKGSRGTVKKYDRRTTSDGYIAVGLNNVVASGESLEDSDFKVAGSRFAELGWTWKTRVFDNSNWLRVRYGLAFQFNGLKPTDNRLFVDTGEQTELQTYPLNLKKSKFRMDNLVIPIHFEFGPSKKIEHDDYFRYVTRDQFKFGIGGYGGINLGARQKLKFEEDGENQKQKLKANYNTNNFIYGLSAYIGWGATSIYAKYDLNTIFKNNAVDQHNVSLGLRLDLE